MVIDESYCFAQQESNSQSVAEKIFAFGGEVLSAAKDVAYSNSCHPEAEESHAQRAIPNEGPMQIACDAGCPTRGCITGGPRCRWDQEILRM
jgi:hypothetical protein